MSKGTQKNKLPNKCSMGYAVANPLLLEIDGALRTIVLTHPTNKLEIFYLELSNSLIWQMCKIYTVLFL
jgi:hypothetical protein